MSENIEQCTLLRRVSILQWDKWPKCLSDQNISAKKNRLQRLEQGCTTFLLLPAALLLFIWSTAAN